MSNSPSTIVLQEATGLLARATALLEMLANRRAAPAVAPVAAPHAPQAPAPALPEYLTTKQAAALLGISAKGLEAMRARGAGPPYVRVGKAVRYRACDLPGAH